MCVRVCVGTYIVCVGGLVRLAIMGVRGLESKAHSRTQGPESFLFLPFRLLWCDTLRSNRCAS